MYCRACQYDLTGIKTGKCPECGSPFDRADATTFDARRRAPQAVVGTALAILIGIAAIMGLWAALMPDYGHSFGAAFATILAIGLVAGCVAAMLAGCNRKWLGRIPLLLVGVISVWLGLFLGSDKGYRVWQSMPNPPDEAFADAAPLGALLMGWLPASILIGIIFGLSLLVTRWRRHG